MKRAALFSGEKNVAFRVDQDQGMIFEAFLRQARRVSLREASAAVVVLRKIYSTLA